MAPRLRAMPQLTPLQERERAQANLAGTVWTLLEQGVSIEDIMTMVRNAVAEYQPSAQPAFIIEGADTPDDQNASDRKV